MPVSPRLGSFRAVPVVSVIVPAWLPDATATAFLPAALESLLAQTLAGWEAVVVDDGSPLPVAPLLPADPRIRLVRHDSNRGLGAALNTGLAATSGGFVAYLPADDLITPEHLETLVAALDAAPAAALAVTGVRHSYNRYATGRVEGRPLQLVQVMHRRTADRWTERAELVTDDLDRMLWSRLAEHGPTVETGEVTCEWVDHPGQLSKVLREPEGGLNTYRSRFAVREPIRMHTTVGNRIDEVAHHRRQRERPDTGRVSASGLKVLLVGELAYNADRVLALEERGHRLYGLWMPDPYWYNTVGPLPFGHVTDLPREGLGRTPSGSWDVDVMYGLLNWQAVPFAGVGAAPARRRAVRLVLQGGPVHLARAGALGRSRRADHPLRRRDLLQTRRCATGPPWRSPPAGACRTTCSTATFRRPTGSAGPRTAALGRRRRGAHGRPGPADRAAPAHRRRTRRAGRAPALLRRLHTRPVARVDREDAPARAPPPAPARAGRSGRLGAGVLPLRRGVAAHVRRRATAVTCAGPTGTTSTTRPGSPPSSPPACR